MKKKVKEELNKILKDYNYSNMVNINWYYLSKHRLLSENFIREFKKKLNWPDISRYQNLSDDFIKEFKGRLDLEALLYYGNISQEFYNNLIDPKPLSRSQILDFS